MRDFNETMCGARQKLKLGQIQRTRTVANIKKNKCGTTLMSGEHSTGPRQGQREVIRPHSGARRAWILFNLAIYQVVR